MRDVEIHKRPLSWIVRAIVVLLIVVFHNILNRNEGIAVWLEAIALIAIFGLDYFEREDNRRERREQQKETLAQLNISRKQVKAAMLSARSAINMERPWLVVTWLSDEDVPDIVNFSCRNKGNTPAKVVAMSAKVCFVNRLIGLEKQPDYSTPVKLPDLDMIVSRRSFRIGEGLNASLFVLDKGKNALISNSEEFLVYYGKVVYRDTLYPDSAPEGLHETRWCFFYQPSGSKRFVRSGPEEYNRYT